MPTKTFSENGIIFELCVLTIFSEVENVLVSASIYKRLIKIISFFFWWNELFIGDTPKAICKHIISGVKKEHNTP